jgi:hypothetical protein
VKARLSSLHLLTGERRKKKRRSGERESRTRTAFRRKLRKVGVTGQLGGVKAGVVERVSLHVDK